jgi:hypothetical protein
MMGSSPQEPGKAPADAGPIAATADASSLQPIDAPAVVPVATKKIKIVTIPPKARILMDGATQTGINGETETPMVVEVVETADKIDCLAQLEGFEEAAFRVNAITDNVEKKAAGVTVMLKKAKPGYKYTPPKNPGSNAAGSGTGSGSGRQGTAGGEYGGYPGASGGTVPKKP